MKMVIIMTIIPMMIFRIMLAITITIMPMMTNKEDHKIVATARAEAFSFTCPLKAP